MAKAPPVRPYVRLRQRPDDTALYVTESGHTRHSPLHGARVILRSNKVPLVELLLNGGSPDDWAPVTFRLSEILAADVDALDWDLLGDWERGGDAYAAQELKDLLTEYRHVLDTSTPQCRHEEIIDTTGLGDTLAQGMCVWCGHHMVAEQRLEVTFGPWREATG
jgi:Zn ribbon nucleic-acid-binding protein